MEGITMIDVLHARTEGIALLRSTVSLRQQRME
jgi:hypothetical protein